MPLPGGFFEMGARIFAGNTGELPRHTRKIAPFAISRYEATIAEYACFARASGTRMAAPCSAWSLITHPCCS
jgi:formylglycine-generating enzyme required for sulfatase activity